MTQSAAGVMNADTERLYRELLDIVRRTAQICGLRIGESTDGRWKSMVGVARQLDCCIDDAVAAGDAEQLVEMLGAALVLFRGDKIASHPDLEAIPFTLRLALGKLRAEAGELSRAQLALLALQISALAISKARQSSAVLYTASLIEEGQVTGQLFLACMTEEEQRQPGFPLFTDWLARAFMCLAVTADHLVDLRDDSLSGRTLVPVRPRSYAIMGLATAGTVAWLVQRNSVLTWRVMRYIAPRLRQLIHDYRASQEATPPITGV